jgi:hypothetical protein
MFLMNWSMFSCQKNICTKYSCATEISQEWGKISNHRGEVPLNVAWRATILKRTNQESACYLGLAMSDTTAAPSAPVRESHLGHDQQPRAKGE